MRSRVNLPLFESTGEKRRLTVIEALVDVLELLVMGDEFINPEDALEVVWTTVARSIREPARTRAVYKTYPRQYLGSRCVP
jgi:hypothetical protein